MAAMSTLRNYRTGAGLSLEQAAIALDLRPSSASWLSEIENGKRDASLRLALRIERWSDGVVTAASVCAELRADKPGLHGDDPRVDDVVTVPNEGASGAGAKAENLQ